MMLRIVRSSIQWIFTVSHFPQFHTSTVPHFHSSTVWKVWNCGLSTLLWKWLFPKRRPKSIIGALDLWSCSRATECGTWFCSTLRHVLCSSYPPTTRIRGKLDCGRKTRQKSGWNWSDKKSDHENCYFRIYKSIPRCQFAERTSPASSGTIGSWVFARLEISSENPTWQQMLHHS